MSETGGAGTRQRVSALLRSTWNGLKTGFQWLMEKQGNDAGSMASPGTDRLGNVASPPEEKRRRASERLK